MSELSPFQKAVRDHKELYGPHTISEKEPKTPKQIIESAVELIQSSLAHVSHGGPTREDAERFIVEAQQTLAGMN